MKKEIRALALLRAELEASPLEEASDFVRAAAELRFHEIHNEEEMAELEAGSKMVPAWQLLTRLQGIGHRTVENWLDQHLADLGVRSTARVMDRYLWDTQPAA